LVKTLVVGESEKEGVYRSYPGRVSAAKKVDMAFEVPGRIIELPAREGQEVEKGQLLAALDVRDYKQAYIQELARYDLAKVSYARFAKLVDSGAVSRARYDEKVAAYKVAAATLETAKKAVEDTKLHAPFSGYLAKRYVENYQYVQAKQRIVSVQNLKEIEIIVDVPEQDIIGKGEVEKKTLGEGGVEVIGTASFEAIPDRRFPLTVKEFKTEADPRTQTYTVTLLMTPPEGRVILPGMTATVHVKFLGLNDEGYWLPVEAVTTNEQGKHVVWVVDKENMIVNEAPVEVGAMQGDEINIHKGVSVGEEIVAAGVGYLQPGMKVKILQGRIGKH